MFWKPLGFLSPWSAWLFSSIKFGSTLLAMSSPHTCSYKGCNSFYFRNQVIVIIMLFKCVLQAGGGRAVSTQLRFPSRVWGFLVVNTSLVYFPVRIIINVFRVTQPSNCRSEKMDEEERGESSTVIKWNLPSIFPLSTNFYPVKAPNRYLISQSYMRDL